MIFRGDVWDADFADHGHRPCVVITRDQAIPVLSRVNVVVVSRSFRGHPAEVELGRHHGLDEPCVANCDVIASVEKALLTRRRGKLDPPALRSLEDALRFALALE